MNRIADFAKKHKTIILEILVILVVFVLTLIQNCLTQFACDDWTYMHIFDNYGYPNGEVYRVKTPLDLLISTKNHWLQWNGRLVPHFLLQLVLTTSYPQMFHKVVFNLVNSGMYILLGIIIYRFATYNHKRSPLLLTGIYAMMWFFIPEYGATILWASGAANYLWTTCIILSFLMPYRKYAVNHENVMRDSLKNAIIMGLLGPIAGCTNENTGCALAFMCMLFVFYYKINNIKIPKWSITGIIGTIIGYVFLLASPGNRREGSITQIENQSFQVYIERLKTIVDNSSDLFFGLLIIFSLVLLIVLITRNKQIAKTDLLLTFIFILGAASSVGILCISSRIPIRSWFLAVSLVILTISYWFIQIDFSNVSKKCITAGVVILLLVCTFSHASAFNAIYETHLQTEAQERLIFKTLSKKGRKNATVQAIIRSDNPHDIYYKEYGAVVTISDNKTDWANVWPAAYYGLDSIVAINKED